MLPAFSRRGLSEDALVSNSKAQIGNQGTSVDACETFLLEDESTERLRRALGQAFEIHPDLLHPEVLQASQALDQEIVRWTKQSQEQHKMRKQTLDEQHTPDNCP